MSQIVRHLTRLPQQHPETTFLLSLFSSGVFLGYVLSNYITQTSLSTANKFAEKNAGAAPVGDGLSVLYPDDTTDVPRVHQVNYDEIGEMKKYLPDDFYKQLVQNSIVACVDCVIVRWDDNLKMEVFMIVERKEEPLRSRWLFPGGRMYKGESFFSAAVRKCHFETGLPMTAIRPMQVLGVYNSFFETSAWDDETNVGTQTVSACVLLRVPNDANRIVTLDKTLLRNRWISVDPEDSNTKNEHSFVLGVLRRYMAVKSKFEGDQVEGIGE